MKNIVTNYAFDASAKTVDFSEYVDFDIKRLQAIINLRTSSIIYAAGIAGKGYSDVTGSVVTLDFDTTTMQDTDPLQPIFLEDTQLDTSALATEETVAAILNKIIAAPATAARQDAMLTLLTAIDGHVDGLEAAIATLNAKDFATQTTMAAILAKLISAPATEAKQDSIVTKLTEISGYIDGLETKLDTLNAKDFAASAKQDTGNASLATIAAKDFATSAKQDTGNASLATIAGKDFGTETTLQAILSELRDDTFVTATLWEDASGASPVFYREERVKSQNDGSVSTIYTRLSDNTTVVSMPAGVIPVDGSTDRDIQYYRWKANTNGTGYSTGDWIANTLVFDTTGSGSVLSSTWYNLTTSNAIAAPTGSHLSDPNVGYSTAAKQDDIITALATLNANTDQLEAYLDNVESKLDTIGAKDFATQATLAAVLAKLIASPATEAKQDSIITLLTSISGYTDGLEGLITTLNGYVDGLETLTGAVNETAPTSDTGNSGLNGRLQRIAQRITSLIALLPSSLGQKTMANSFAVTIASDQSSIPVAGNVAHDAVDSGNPLKIGGKARQTNPAAVADADRVDAVFDDIGRQVVIIGQPRDLTLHTNITISSSTAENDLIAAGAAGVYNDIVGVVIANSSATATWVHFKDAASGTTRFSIYAPAGQTTGFIPARPVKQSTTAAKWTATCGTSVADIKIFVQYDQNI